MPVAKLAALQKIIQSDFFCAVREVYEHIYQTMDHGPNMTSDLKASATAKVNLYHFIFMTFIWSIQRQSK